MKHSFVVTKREFICVPFEKAFSITNIKAGFSKCGIYPYNQDPIARNKMLHYSSMLSPIDSCTSSGGSTVASLLSVKP